MKFFHKLNLLLFLLVLPVAAGAQTILVVDAETGERIPDVAVFNEDRTASALSDDNGVADLSAFTRREQAPAP